VAAGWHGGEGVGVAVIQGRHVLGVLSRFVTLEDASGRMAAIVARRGATLTGERSGAVRAGRSRTSAS
jgi:hypothetical protein